MDLRGFRARQRDTLIQQGRRTSILTPERIVYFLLVRTDSAMSKRLCKPLLIFFFPSFSLSTVYVLRTLSYT